MAKNDSANNAKEVFSLEAPEAQAVHLVGSFTNWEQNPVKLKKQKSGLWKASVSLGPGSHEYRFVVDGNWVDDPSCCTRAPNPFGGENCVRIVA